MNGFHLKNTPCYTVFHMMKRVLLLAIISLILTPFNGLRAAFSIQPGDLIKASGPAVYYYNKDGKRLVFPNEKTYYTWYSDFSDVKTVTDAELAAITIGGNVTFRPGKSLVKITTDPKVYAVDAHGVLRWITTEEIAIALYGSDWAKKVHDIPDAFFVDYEIGSSILSDAAFNPSAILAANPVIESQSTTPSTDPVIDRGVVKTSEVTVGDLFRVTLDSNPTTGYSWKPSFSSEYLSFVTSTYVPADATIMGAGGTERFDFRALKQTSQTDIVFDYVRSWETNTAPAERRVFRMIINSKPISNSDILFSANKTEAQAGETIRLSASTTVANPTSIKINVGNTLVQECNRMPNCVTDYEIPSSGTASSYTFSASVTSSDGSTATTTLSIPIATSQTRSDISFTINKTVIRPNQVVDIFVNPSGVINVRNITILIDSIEVKRCENNPINCRYSDDITGSAGSVHAVYAVLTSSSGLNYKTVTKYITVSNNDAPTVNVSAGKPGVYKTETLDISVTSSDDDGIGSMTLMQGNTVIKTCNGPAPCTATVGPFPTFSTGDSIRFWGTATDLLGQSASSTQEVVVTIL